MMPLARGFAGKVLAASLLSTAVYAGNMSSSSMSNRWLPCGELTLQAGFFNATQGHNQHIAIQDLIGDDFSVNHRTNTNALFGLAYYLKGPSLNYFNLQYGLNVLYFLQTKVSGNITQENLFTNLSYQYHVTNVPVFFAAKALFPWPNESYQATLDAGIGPNVISTGGYSEHSLDGVTLPDNIYKGHTTTAFAAMARISLRANHLLPVPVECGYQFTWLGQGNLAKENSQVISTLNTGNNYANSLMCGVVFS